MTHKLNFKEKITMKKNYNYYILSYTQGGEMYNESYRFLKTAEKHALTLCRVGIDCTIATYNSAGRFVERVHYN